MILGCAMRFDAQLRMLNAELGAGKTAHVETLSLSLSPLACNVSYFVPVRSSVTHLNHGLFLEFTALGI